MGSLIHSTLFFSNESYCNEYGIMKSMTVQCLVIVSILLIAGLTVDGWLVDKKRSADSLSEMKTSLTSAEEFPSIRSSMKCIQSGRCKRGSDCCSGNCRNGDCRED